MSCLNGTSPRPITSHPVANLLSPVAILREHLTVVLASTILLPTFSRPNLFLPRSKLCLILHLLHLPMSPQTLVPPADLPAISFAVLLRIPLCRLDGSTGIDEEEGGHGESSHGRHERLV